MSETDSSSRFEMPKGEKPAPADAEAKTEIQAVSPIVHADQTEDVDPPLTTALNEWMEPRFRVR